MPSSNSFSSFELPKVLGPAEHGVIDYCHAAFFLTVGFFCRKSNKPAAAAAFLTGGTVLIQSLLTDYPLGAKPAMSFKTHGKIDSIFAASSWMMPLLFGFKGTAAAKIFEVNSAVESTVVAMTDWDSERAHEERIAA